MVTAVTEGPLREGIGMHDEAVIRRWIRGCSDEMAANRDFLTQLDAAIGDADHGINMDRGFSAALVDLDATDDMPPGELLIRAGGTLIYRVGGAAGPLFGTWLRRAGESLADSAVVRHRGPAQVAASRARRHPGARRGGGGRQDDRRRVRAGPRGVRAEASGGRRPRRCRSHAARRPRARGPGRRFRCRRARGAPPTWGRGASATRTRARPRPPTCSPRSPARWTVPGDRAHAGHPDHRPQGHDPVGGASLAHPQGARDGLLPHGRDGDRRTTRARQGHRLRAAAHARVAGAGGAGSRDRQVPAGAGDAPARQRVPRQPRVAGALAAVGGLARVAGRGGGARRRAARAERADRAPRLPPRQLGADPRGRRLDPLARVRPRQGDRRLPARGRPRRRCSPRSWPRSPGAR